MTSIAPSHNRFDTAFYNMPLEVPNKGHWELDLKTNHLLWSDYQYKIYGYLPYEINLNTEFFILKTTHYSEINRITEIINNALEKHEGYNFKRRIVRKNGSIGFVETHAKIIRSSDGIPSKIIGTTLDISREIANEQDNFTSPQFFEVLYSNYNQAIFSKIFALVKEKNISKDLCQEVFVKAWNNMSTYNKEKGELYTWLINIARNHCIDYFRSKNFRSKKNTSSLDQINSYLIKNESFNLDRFDISNLLSKLNPDEKELIELLFLQGFTQNEVAKIKKLPLGSIKTKSRNVLNTLRKIALE